MAMACAHSSRRRILGACANGFDGMDDVHDAAQPLRRRVQWRDDRPLMPLRTATALVGRTRAVSPAD